LDPFLDRLLHISRCSREIGDDTDSSKEDTRSLVNEGNFVKTVISNVEGQNYHEHWLGCDVEGNFS